MRWHDPFPRQCPNKHSGTEPKILDDIASRTDEASTGTVILHTERYPCENRTWKGGKVHILWGSQHVTILVGLSADRFLSRIADASDDEAQLIMAKATGNFKRGNEGRGR